MWQENSPNFGPPVVSHPFFITGQRCHSWLWFNMQWTTHSSFIIRFTFLAVKLEIKHLNVFDICWQTARCHHMLMMFMMSFMVVSFLLHSNQDVKIARLLLLAPVFSILTLALSESINKSFSASINLSITEGPHQVIILCFDLFIILFLWWWANLCAYTTPLA